MNYILLTLKNAQADVKLLVPESIEAQIIIDCANDLFNYQAAMQAALKDFLNDHSATLTALKSKVNHLKQLGIIGYPLDAHDAQLYALDRNLKITTRKADARQG